MPTLAEILTSLRPPDPRIVVVVVDEKRERILEVRDQQDETDLAALLLLQKMQAQDTPKKGKHTR